MRKRYDGIIEFIHAPGAKLDYSIDWNAILYVGESIITSDWTSSSTDITLSDSSTASGVTTIYAAGGTKNKTYYLTNTITTNHSPDRIDVRNIVLVCQDR